MGDDGPGFFELVRVDSGSSIDSNATAPNLPGPGRNVGLLYDHLGARLESALNRGAVGLAPSTLFRRQQERRIVAQHSLVRRDTVSSIDSNATASNLVGPGRTLGLLLDYLGSRFEFVLNRRASRLGLGPEAVANDIRHLRNHHETTIGARHATLVSSLTKSEVKALRKLCKKLISHTR